MRQVTVRYQLKVPGEADFSMKGTEIEITEEVPEGTDTGEVAAHLISVTKLATFASLGVGFHEDADGVLQPVIEARDVPTFNPKGRSQRSQRTSGSNAAAGSTSGVAAGATTAAPKADRSELDVVELDYFDNGEPIAFYDQRPLKADGTYKPNAADFASVDRFDLRGDGRTRSIPLWITGKDGDVNEDVVDLLSGAGLELENA